MIHCRGQDIHNTINNKGKTFDDTVQGMDQHDTVQRDDINVTVCGGFT